jgi:tyrosyl-tRNA synthetase
MTALVHGREAAEHASAAAEVLFGGDPTTASAETLAVVAAEVPCLELDDLGHLDDVADSPDHGPGRALEGRRVHELLVSAGVASSTSEVGRLLTQGAIRAGNRVLGKDGLLQASDLLNGGFVLLRKGKRDFVLGKVSTRG